MESTRDHALARARLLEECLAACQEALATDPDDADAHALAAWCHLGLGRDDDAFEAAMRAIRAAPDWPESRRLLAAVQVQRGDMKAARGAIEEAVRLDPEDPAFHAFLADLHADERRWVESFDASARAGSERSRRGGARGRAAAPRTEPRSSARSSGPRLGGKLELVVESGAGRAVTHGELGRWSDWRLVESAGDFVRAYLEDGEGGRRHVAWGWDGLLFALGQACLPFDTYAYAIERVPAGAYSLVVYGPAIETTRIPAEIVNGRKTELRVRPAPRDE